MPHGNNSGAETAPFIGQEDSFRVATGEGPPFSLLSEELKQEHGGQGGPRAQDTASAACAVLGPLQLRLTQRHGSLYLQWHRGLTLIPV